MIISLSNNPIDRLECFLLNTKENIHNKLASRKWRSAPHHVNCRICGANLNSRDSEYTPEECGWVNVKPAFLSCTYGFSGWVCHSCSGHFYEHFINMEDLTKEEFKVLKEREVIPKYMEWEYIQDRRR